MDEAGGKDVLSMPRSATTRCFECRVCFFEISLYESLLTIMNYPNEYTDKHFTELWGGVGNNCLNADLRSLYAR